MQILIDKDIAKANADVIVNAANGCGYMCGSQVAKAKKREDVPMGISESLNFYTKGNLEKEIVRKIKESRRICKNLSPWLRPLRPGSYIITDSCGLNCKKVFHAVTMYYPGTRSKLRYVQELIPEIFRYCKQNGYTSVALPLLGCGTGKLDKGTVMQMIKEESEKYLNINVYVYNSSKK